MVSVPQGVSPPGLLKEDWTSILAHDRRPRAAISEMVGNPARLFSGNLFNECPHPFEMASEVPQTSPDYLSNVRQRSADFPLETCLGIS